MLTCGVESCCDNIVHNSWLLDVNTLFHGQYLIMIILHCNCLMFAVRLCCASCTSLKFMILYGLIANLTFVLILLLFINSIEYRSTIYSTYVRMYINMHESHN